jgi:hypothetical protein
MRNKITIVFDLVVLVSRSRVFDWPVIMVFDGLPDTGSSVL